MDTIFMINPFEKISFAIPLSLACASEVTIE